MPKLTNAIQKTEVLKWTQELCRCLEAQYRNYSLRYVMDSQNGSDKYLQERARKIENDEECIKFTITSGKKYHKICLLYTSPSPRDRQKSRMPSSA